MRVGHFRKKNFRAARHSNTHTHTHTHTQRVTNHKSTSLVTKHMRTLCSALCLDIFRRKIRSSATVKLKPEKLFQRVNAQARWIITPAAFCEAGAGIGYGLDNPGIVVRVLAVPSVFSLLHQVHTGSGGHPASSSMGTMVGGGFASCRRSAQDFKLTNHWRCASNLL
jgi:hypothetical protein